jgi:hypothetical protein
MNEEREKNVRVTFKKMEREKERERGRKCE